MGEKRPNPCEPALFPHCGLAGLGVLASDAPVWPRPEWPLLRLLVCPAPFSHLPVSGLLISHPASAPTPPPSLCTLLACPNLSLRTWPLKVNNDV